MQDLSEQIADRSEQATVRFGGHASGELDFSEASLNVVETILDEAVDFMEETSPENVEGLSRTLAATSMRWLVVRTGAPIIGLTVVTSLSSLSANPSIALRS